MPRLDYAKWLNATPRVELMVDNVGVMDLSGVLAFCDAVGGSTKPHQLWLGNVASVGDFHGRRLPSRLRIFEWHPHDQRTAGDYFNDAMARDVAYALDLQRLGRSGCDYFGQLLLNHGFSHMKNLEVDDSAGQDNDTLLLLLVGLAQFTLLANLKLPEHYFSTYGVG
ncbi:hypothetical protein SPRG_02760 [Saprolegnia parasitica CBS 223.65]|uniref:Uncharacterized protein n=1 Tax=Saprolegnia parasitica (strain CBS 223.65) TaxID=695850 RepID=A0A067D0K0_SAPPC|nr:hypothetical protein SPRG_02760 [Saprolegnia parasitica CBS 223.65]KDO32281.1 hypothetical protein SPRG_02760 [Saprolegnia parasitica CBS 223.65]|eukprot:XP_012196737.1 hypothetical protein SPRG_02760 [Saprolegnia parasitica CBS 223.65]